MSLFVHVACDQVGCGKELPMYYTTQDCVRRIASEYGWSVEEDGEAICPECLKKFPRKPQKEDNKIS